MSPETVHAKPSGTPSACFHYWLGLKSEPRHLTAWAPHGSSATLFQTAFGPKNAIPFQVGAHLYELKPTMEEVNAMASYGYP